MTRNEKEKYTNWAIGAALAIAVAVFAPREFNPVEWIKSQIGGFQA